jgi:hypothetical protein
MAGRREGGKSGRDDAAARGNRRCLNALDNFECR